MPCLHFSLVIELDKDLEKKVEKAMPIEDGEDAQATQQTSFVPREQNKEEGPSMGQVFLYMAKKLKDIDEKLEVIIKREKPKAKSKKRVTKEVKEITAPAGPEPQTPQPNSKIDNIKMMFPENLENLLAFSMKDDYILIKPRQFLGSDNFAKIGAIIRGMRGDYISAGKDSHFRVAISELAEVKPVETPKEQPKIDGESPRLVEIKKALGNLLELVDVNTTASASMITIKPKEFLGSEIFNKIIAIVRNLGGNYVSQGKESHFNIPKNG